jgi:GxxExxY protein
MGPGLLESIYERCLMRELELRGIPVLNQEEVVIDYKGTVFKETLKFDLLIDGCLLVELKAINDVLPIHKAQLLSYMKLLDVPLGLLFNFHEVIQGVRPSRGSDLNKRFLAILGRACCNGVHATTITPSVLRRDLSCHGPR